MDMFKGISRAGSACLLALAAGCASQQGGNAAQAIMQGAANAVGAGLAGMSGAAAPAGAKPPDSAQSSGGGKVATINGILITVEGAPPSDARWAGKRLRDTSLFHYFAKHPISRPGEYFPRIGIRIDDYAPSLLSDNVITKHLAGVAGAGPRPPECLKFTAMLWTSERKQQRFDGLVLCNADIGANDSHMSMGALKNYQNNLYAPVSISSMQMRTLGPRVPEKLLPDFTRDDVTLYSNGQHLFSALFDQLGYAGAIDGDQRLWFVNLAAAAK